MKSAYSIIRSLFMLSLLMTAGILFAQEGTPDSEFKPRVGQEGKDVVWVPTPQELVDTMLSIAKVTSTLVPAMALIYFIGAILVISTNYQNILPSLASIFTDAFTGSNLKKAGRTDKKRTQRNGAAGSRR